MRRRCFRFHKASYSDAERECVEVASNVHGVVAVRDSKRAEHSPVMHASPRAWAMFVTGLSTEGTDVMTEFAFRKSSYSDKEHECVEVATNVPHVVAIRDSKRALDSPVLHIAPRTWSAFLEDLSKRA